jgi:carbonic anhydrase/acetyltransferase-like protein (isoleucine patch superfamily)
MLYELDGVSPDIDGGAWIAPGCHLIGKVCVMELA